MYKWSTNGGIEVIQMEDRHIKMEELSRYLKFPIWFSEEKSRLKINTGNYCPTGYSKGHKPHLGFCPRDNEIASPPQCILAFFLGGAPDFVSSVFSLHMVRCSEWSPLPTTGRTFLFIWVGESYSTPPARFRHRPGMQFWPLRSESWALLEEWPSLMKSGWDTKVSIFVSRSV